MKKLLSLAIGLALASVLILTKQTPQDIADAATGQTSYIVINREKMPSGFTGAVKEALATRAVAAVFALQAPGAILDADWRAGEGALRCLWLLRHCAMA